MVCHSSSLATLLSFRLGRLKGLSAVRAVATVPCRRRHYHRPPDVTAIVISSKKQQNSSGVYRPIDANTVLPSDVDIVLYSSARYHRERYTPATTVVLVFSELGHFEELYTPPKKPDLYKTESAARRAIPWFGYLLLYKGERTNSMLFHRYMPRNSGDDTAGVALFWPKYFLNGRAP